MKFTGYLNISFKIFKSYLGKKIPFSVSWSLTNRCNKKCYYCNIYNIKSRELTTKQIFKIIDQLKDLGCERIGFTGGEPLLRRDIGKILNYCKKKNIFTGIVTNAVLLPRRIKEIRKVDLLQFSLDGKKEINDKHRYKGAFDDTIEGIKLAKKYGIRTWITCVLAKDNLNQVDYMLEIAKKYNTKIFFQPIVDYRLCGLNSKKLLPKASDFRKTIGYIMELKKKGNSNIGNSLPCLQYLLNWPEKSKMRCFAGKLFFHIYTDGTIYPCFNFEGKDSFNSSEINLKDGIRKLKRPDCNSCYTYANIEFNNLFSFNPKTIKNTLNLLR